MKKENSQLTAEYMANLMELRDEPQFAKCIRSIESSRQELLAALKLAVNAYECSSEIVQLEDFDLNWVVDARLAIDKAEGRS